MIELLERFINPASVEVHPDLKPEFILPDFDEEAFEAEFNTPEAQEDDQLSISKRVGLAAVGAAVAVAGVAGYEVGQPSEDEIHISPDQIAADLNSGDRTTEPVVIEQGSELVIPKESPNDSEIKVVNPIKLGEDTYAAAVVNDDGKVEIIPIPTNASLQPVENTEGEKSETQEIVYPMSVVHTDVPVRNGKNERVYSVVAGDTSGDAANLVKIDEKNATPEQKQLLKDKTFRSLVKKAIGLTAQERVGYLDIAS